MSPPYVTPLHRWLEKLVTTRLLTWFSPCIWSDPLVDGGSRVRAFLHGSWLGRKVTDAFWKILGDDVVSLNRFNAHPETKKLKPWISPFWVASGLSILNYPTNFFDLITAPESRVRIHVDHITHLAEHGTIHLANSRALTNIDALIVASGWKPTPDITFRPASLPSDLGFPTAPDPIPSSVIHAANAEILRRFPRLAKRPIHSSPKPYAPLAQDAQTETQSLHPFRLTRFLVPVGGKLAAERSVALMGVAMTINTPLLAQTQALWIAAFFAGRLSPAATVAERCPAPLRAVLDKDSKDSGGRESRDVLWETALHTQFGVHRYPGGLGRRNPDFVFDAIPYVDVLLRDLGMSGGRKDGRGWKRWVEAYGVEDYVGLVEEWMHSGEK
ncbi:flavin-binding monooxygenase-like protein [Aspergillus lucknowensis]|uniref:FAD/NAD(P)-binding domain-containing protein n=1 Tax=Aspergillus lucknowensis TaxID=176173 RepID=A0ABR4M4T2_9EURO